MTFGFKKYFLIFLFFSGINLSANAHVIIYKGTYGQNNIASITLYGIAKNTDKNIAREESRLMCERKMRDFSNGNIVAGVNLNTEYELSLVNNCAIDVTISEPLTVQSQKFHCAGIFDKTIKIDQFEINQSGSGRNVTLNLGEILITTRSDTSKNPNLISNLDSMCNINIDNSPYGNLITNTLTKPKCSLQEETSLCNDLCPIGQGRMEGGACEMCGIMQESTDENRTCVDCEDGEITNAKRSICLPCGRNSIIIMNNNKHVCKTCLTGPLPENYQYNLDTCMTTCMKDIEQRYDISSNTCKTCPEGTKLSDDKYNCVKDCGDGETTFMHNRCPHECDDADENMRLNTLTQMCECKNGTVMNEGMCVCPNDGAIGDDGRCVTPNCMNMPNSKECCNDQLMDFDGLICTRCQTAEYFDEEENECMTCDDTPTILHDLDGVQKSACVQFNNYTGSYTKEECEMKGWESKTYQVGNDQTQGIGEFCIIPFIIAMTSNIINNDNGEERLVFSDFETINKFNGCLLRRDNNFTPNSNSEVVTCQEIFTNGGYFPPINSINADRLYISSDEDGSFLALRHEIEPEDILRLPLDDSITAPIEPFIPGPVPTKDGGFSSAAILLAGGSVAAALLIWALWDDSDDYYYEFTPKMSFSMNEQGGYYGYGGKLNYHNANIDIVWNYERNEQNDSYFSSGFEMNQDYFDFNFLSRTYDDEKTDFYFKLLVNDRWGSWDTSYGANSLWEISTDPYNPYYWQHGFEISFVRHYLGYQIKPEFTLGYGMNDIDLNYKMRLELLYNLY